MPLPAQRALTILLTLFSGTLPGAVVEVVPGQLRPPQQPTVALSLQSMDTQASGRYSSGSSNQNEHARSRSLRLSGFYFQPVGQTPVVLSLSSAHERAEGRRLTPALEQQVSGTDDLRLGAGFWPLADYTNQRYLLLAAVAALPTGRYDPASPLNIGENRKRLSLIAGYSSALSPRWSWEGYLLYNRFGENPDYLNSGSQSQDDSASLTGYLVHEVAPHSQLYAGLEYIYGSNIYLNGTKIADGQRDLRGYLGGSMPISRRDRIGLRLGKSIQVETGLKEDSQLILSLTHLF